jgi:protein-tyrosine phosphatase
MIDLDWLTPDLAIGGAFTSDAAEALAREHRIGGVVDLRAEACDEVRALARHGLELLHLPTADHCAVAPDMLRAGVAFTARHLAVRGRVLIHCQHGIGRSALLALCVLVDRGHEPLAALELAKTRRARVSPSPAQYEAWAAWLRARDIAPPSFDAFAAIAYRHLRR